MPEAPLDHHEPTVEVGGVRLLQQYIADRIRDLDITESEVARRAGMSKQSLNRLIHEPRATIPDVDMLDRLAVALRVPRRTIRQVAAEAYGYVVASGDGDAAALVASIEELPEGRRRDLERLAEMYLREAQSEDDQRRHGRDK